MRTALFKCPVCGYTGGHSGIVMLGNAKTTVVNTLADCPRCGFAGEMLDAHYSASESGDPLVHLLRPYSAEVLALVADVVERAKTQQAAQRAMIAKGVPADLVRKVTTVPEGSKWKKHRAAVLTALLAIGAWTGKETLGPTLNRAGEELEHIIFGNEVPQDPPADPPQTP